MPYSYLNPGDSVNYVDTAGAVWPAVVTKVYTNAQFSPIDLYWTDPADHSQTHHAVTNVPHINPNQVNVYYKDGEI
jgi:hypothetical protein